MIDQTYLTTDELSSKIKYDVRTIRERLKDSVLLEGIHYVRPFGGRKILFVWETIERDMKTASSHNPLAMNAIPMANGGALRGVKTASSHNSLVRNAIPMANGGALNG